jgi:chloride channel protein, CIC family
MVIELSGNYTAILPVMISTLVAYLISRRYQRVPLFDLLARQDGLVLPSIEERREQVVLVVEDAMRRNAAIVVDPAESVLDVARRVDANPELPLLCCVKVGEWRLLDKEQIQKLVAELASHVVDPAGNQRGAVGATAGGTGRAGTVDAGSEAAGGAAPRAATRAMHLTAGDVDFKGPLPMIFPDESFDEVLRWAGDWTVLPVVNRADLGKLEGVLTLADILRAFRKAAE